MDPIFYEILTNAQQGHVLSGMGHVYIPLPCICTSSSVFPPVVLLLVSSSYPALTVAAFALAPLVLVWLQLNFPQNRSLNVCEIVR